MAGAAKSRAKRPKGRTLAEFGPLLPAEKKLLDACASGKLASVDDKRPEKRTDENRVRPEFLRFLALGGDEHVPVHEQGVYIRGAWIDGHLDLEGCRIPTHLNLWSCNIASNLTLRDSDLLGLSLQNSKVPKIYGDGLHCRGDVFLHDGFHATGEVRLLGAHIGGSLFCTGGRFENTNGDALSCDQAEIGGSVFLDAETGKDKFHATGTVRLLGAHIGGDLNCSGGRFENANGRALTCDRAEIGGGVFLNTKAGGEKFHATGEVRLPGAHIGGNLNADGGQLENKNGMALHCRSAEIKGNLFLRYGFRAKGEVDLYGARVAGDLDCSHAHFENTDGDALRCDRTIIGGTFIFRKVATVSGRISLVAAHVGTLVDDLESYPPAPGLVLDGFRYDRVVAEAPIDAASVITWLKKQPFDHLHKEFKPQPWEQAIKLLREMGHEEHAKLVAIEKQKQLRRAKKIKWPGAIFHFLFYVFAGYGYRPMWTFRWVVTVWLGCTAFYWYAAVQGVFAPSNPRIFTDPRFEMCSPQRMGNWVTCNFAPLEHVAFNPLAYSLDLILPLVDLQQESSWTPMVERPNALRLKSEGWLLGSVTRIITWLEILFGWIASLMLVAAVSVQFKKD